MFKRISYLIPFVLLITGIGNAQLLRSIAAKIAYSSADQIFTYTGTTLSFNPDRLGVINAAISVELFDGSPFALLVQCEYAQRGMSDTFGISGPTSPEIIRYERIVSRVRYLSVPLFAKIYILKNLLSPYVLGGGRIDFVLGHKSDRNAFSTLYDDFAKTTYGLSGGLGAEFSISPQLALLCEARYNLDLKDSYKGEFLRVKNNSIDMWLGVAFAI